MRTALIKFRYTQGIGTSTGNGTFENNVLAASFGEFVTRSQAYNKDGNFTTFHEMMTADSRASALHYVTGFAVGSHIAGLGNKIPGLTDNEGRSILFSRHQFNIINSDITNIAAHKVSITYFTDTMTVLDNIGDYLLVAYGDCSHELLSTHPKDIKDAFLLKIVPGLSVLSYTPIKSVSLEKSFRIISVNNLAESMN